MKKTAANNKKPGALGSKDKKVLLVIAVVILAIIGFFGYRQFAIVQEKRHFEQAYEDIEKLRQEIAAELGEPTAVEQEKSCGYSSAKFSKGRLGCAVSKSFAYVADSDEFNSRFQSTQNVIAKSEVFSVGSGGDDTLGYADESIGSIGKTFSLSSKHNMNCFVSYFFAKPPNPRLKIEAATDRYNFSVRISCSKEAGFEHYPLTN